MTEPPDTTYTFGDSDPAIERLGLMARLFARGTAVLLARWAPERPAVALDLGCGPGHTAAAVARRCRPAAIVAVDASPAMVAAAERRLDELRRTGLLEPGLTVTGAVADVTGPTLPGVPADLVHARYVLAHLAEPLTVLDRWCTQLRPGGRVLVDEIEHVDTTVEPFRRYLDTVAAMLADHGTDLFVGRALADHRPAAGVVVGSAPVELPQPPPDVARMFALNLAVWRQGPWARANHRGAELDDLAAALAEVAASEGDAAGTATWTHRQVAIERPAH